MDLQLPAETVFHSIENAIRTYRKFAQEQISEHIDGITVDQSLALIYIHKFPGMSHHSLADLLFKDGASLTRMIKTMEKNDFLQREINPEDLRRYQLKLTPKGSDIVQALSQVIKTNRSRALQGISAAEETQLKTILQKIIDNCNQPKP